MNQERNFELKLSQVQATLGLSHSQVHSNPKCVSKWNPMDPKGIKWNERHKMWCEQGDRIEDISRIWIKHSKCLNSQHCVKLGFEGIRVKESHFYWFKP